MGSIYYRCGCGAEVPLNLSKCPICKRPNGWVKEVGQPTRPALSNKQRLKNEAESRRSPRQGAAAVGPSSDPQSPHSAHPRAFPPRLRAQLLGQPGRWYLSSGDCCWPVRVVSDIDEMFLATVVLEWERIDIEGNLVLVGPAPGPDLSAIRFCVNEAKRQAKIASYGIRPQGSTSIERMPSPLEQTQEVARLADMKDDPAAWADIASCWRIKSLRRPIERAFESIGWEKINWLVHATDGWPAELIDRVDKELNKKNQPRPLKPWDPGDYLLADD